MVVFCADNIDFVEESLMVAGDDSMTVLFKIISDELFSVFAYGSGVLFGFNCRCEAEEGLTGFERFTVFWGETIFINSCDVSFGAVADVLVKSVLGVFIGEVYHIMITGDFGDNGGGGDFAYFIVAFDAGGSVLCQRGGL